MLVAPMLVALLAADPRPRDIVVSTDCGAEVDDQWALTHLALSPEVRIVGVVTTHAPGLSPEKAAGVARETFGRLKDVKAPSVVAGRAAPLKTAEVPPEHPGARFLLDSAKLRTPDHRLTVVMIGAATDVASALLIDPSWADRVTVVAMAFDGWPEGGDPWNVKNDVSAWQVVMGSRVPLVVGDARVTRKHLIQTPASARERLGARGEFLAGMLDRWIARNPTMAESASGRPGAWPIWDEVTTAYLLGFTTQEERPRPSLNDDRSLDHAHPEGRVTWITEIDTERLWADLARKLP